MWRGLSDNALASISVDLSLSDGAYAFASLKYRSGFVGATFAARSVVGYPVGV